MKAFQLIFATLLMAFFSSTCLASVQFGPGAPGEDSLQEVLDDIATDGDIGIDVVNDQFAPDEYWSITGSGGSISTIVIEITANSGTNSLRLFDAANPGNTVQLFAGSDAAGAQKSVSIMLDGSVYVNFADTGVDFAGNLFGFMLQTPNGNFYTDPTLNGGGLDRVATYQGNGETIQIGAFAPGVFTDSEYIFAFEDGVAGANPYPGDGDYQDFVFIAESISPVPEATTIIIWSALGTIGFLAYRRRQLA